MKYHEVLAPLCVFCVYCALKLNQQNWHSPWVKVTITKFCHLQALPQLASAHALPPSSSSTFQKVPQRCVYYCQKDTRCRMWVNIHLLLSRKPNQYYRFSQNVLCSSIQTVGYCVILFTSNWAFAKWETRCEMYDWTFVLSLRMHIAFALRHHYFYFIRSSSFSYIIHGRRSERMHANCMRIA